MSWSGTLLLRNTKAHEKKMGERKEENRNELVRYIPPRKRSTWSNTLLSVTGTCSPQVGTECARSL